MVVQLNVGGHVYYTTVDTLGARGENMLTAMFKHPNPAQMIGEAYFIDRDPEIFRWLLLYFRGSNILPLRNSTELWLLKEEAEYFAIDELSTRIQHILSPSFKPKDHVMIRGTKCTIVKVDKNGYMVTRQGKQAVISAAENVEPTVITKGDLVMAWNRMQGKHLKGICIGINGKDITIQFDEAETQVACPKSGVRF
jgi:hypothetical protein